MNVQDSNGDTALHDASRFCHTQVVKALVDNSSKNSKGETAADVAKDYDKTEVATQLA
jgi:hypothetical protein